MHFKTSQHAKATDLRLHGIVSNNLHLMTAWMVEYAAEDAMDAEDLAEYKRLQQSTGATPHATTGEMVRQAA